MSIGAYANSFELLAGDPRGLRGSAAGGVFPVGMGLTGDLFPVEKRRVAMSRIMAGALTGNLLARASPVWSAICSAGAVCCRSSVALSS